MDSLLNMQEEHLTLKSLRRGLGGGIDGVAAEYFVCDEVGSHL